MTIIKMCFHFAVIDALDYIDFINKVILHLLRNFEIVSELCIYLVAGHLPSQPITTEYCRNYKINSVFTGNLQFYNKYSAKGFSYIL